MKALFRSQHYILTLGISVWIQSKLLRYNKFYNFNVEWTVLSKIILAIAIQKILIKDYCFLTKYIIRKGKVTVDDKRVIE